MASGFLESLTSGKRFVSAISYYPNRISFGYYAFLYLFENALKADRTILYPLMNYTNAVCSIIMVIPFFYVIRRYWGYTAAIIANLVLISVPIWQQVSIYGHPQTPAVLFVFTGLALLGHRSHLESLNKATGVLFVWDIIVLMAFILSLAMRMDALLMFPLIMACLLLEGRSFRSALLHFILYSVFSVVIYFMVLSRIPENMDTVSVFLQPQAIVVRAIKQFIPSTVLFIKAYPRFLLLTYYLSCLFLLYSGKYYSIVFVLPVVLINYLFYMPSPGDNGRHFHFIAPVVAAGIAILLSKIVEIFRLFRSYGSTLTGALSAFLIFFTVFFVIGKYDGIGYYRNEYSEEQAYNLGKLSEDLIRLGPLDRPVFVVSFARTVLVNMQMMENPIKIIREDDIFYVRTDRNEFVFCKEGEWEDNVMELLEIADLRGKTYWIIDPYNSDINTKPFNTQVPPPHQRIYLHDEKT